MTDVFISYKREERPRCVAIYNALVDLKLSVWFDGRIEPGTSFDREIEREVEGAKAILVLWSELARNSDWIRNEARTGKQGERLVAARLDDCLPPLEFRSVQTVDLFDAGNFQSGEGWCQIVGRIGRLTGRTGLGDYVRCEQAADAAQWENWLATHGDDPLAAKAGERLAELRDPGEMAARAPTSAASSKVPNKSKSPPALSTGTPTGAPIPAPKPFYRFLRTFRRTGYGWILGILVILAVGLAPYAYFSESRHTEAEQAAQPVAPAASAEWQPPAEMDAAERVAAAANGIDTSAAPLPEAKKPAATTAPVKQIAIADVSSLNCGSGPYVIPFDEERARPRADAATTLNLVATTWKNCGGPIRLEGHTGRNFAGNSIELSERMALSVADSLAARGVNIDHISTLGLGKFRPRATSSDIRNWRVEVHLAPD